MSTLTLQLPEEIQRRLQARAREMGSDPANVALEILEKGLHESPTPENPNDLPYEVWRERFDAWIKNVPQVHRGFVDDSREAIYEGRGE